MRRLFAPSWLVLLGSLLLSACRGGSGTPPPDASTTCPVDDDCDDGLFCNGAETCAPEAASADPRGCLAGAPPCADRCDDTGDRCADDCSIPDADGDGQPALACGGLDCDDSDPDVSPAATEVCDAEGRDEDCDPTTFGARDADGDGFFDALCCNGAMCGDDCDDSRANVSRTSPEVCNGFDDDCDGSVDEGVLVVGYADRDFDLHGDPDAATSETTTATVASTRAAECTTEESTVRSTVASTRALRPSTDPHAPAATSQSSPAAARRRPAPSASTAASTASSPSASPSTPTDPSSP